MHVKTNIEPSSIQIVVLAICPLITVMSSVEDAVFFVLGTIVCLILSQLFCAIFNKYLTNNVKTMLTAIITSFLVVIATIVAKQNYNIVLNPNAYFIIFSTVVLSVEFYYFKGIALIKHFAFNNLKTMFLFALVSFVFAGIKEFLAFGKLYGKTIFSSFSGVEFFGSIVFSLILLAVLCFLFDIVVRIVEKKIKDRKLVYQKYVKIIRNEKAFQYDLLRREKLLANQVEVNRINRVEADKIIQKESENEAIESVKEVVTEESDIAVPEEKSDETDENNENTESISSEDTGEKNEAEESDKKKKHKKKGGKK